MSSLPRKLFGASTTSDDPGSTAQPALPRLPVPDLDRTMNKYMATLQPLLTNTQLEYTKSLVQTFLAPEGPGPKIQAQLLHRQQRMDNWAYDWWLQDMYLNIPLCLPVNVNPGMVFPPRVGFRTSSDIARLAARWVALAVRHKHKLDRRALPVEKATSREKGQPLCMAQFYRLFSSYRAPGLQRDTLISIEPAAGQHVIVACNNQLYKMNVVDKTEPEVHVGEEELASQFMYILNNTKAALPIGILTSQRRDRWAESRDMLLKDEQNQRNLETIEKSLMIICLDQKPLPTKFNRKGGPRGGDGHRAGDRDETNMALQMLHGGGSGYNSGNRWFDKTIQLVISSDGVNGLCYEHSPSEGIAVIQLMEEFIENSSDLMTGDSNASPVNSSSGTLQPLQWNTSPALDRHIRDAQYSLDNLIEDLDFFVYRYNGYGKDFIKSVKVSPDAYIQLALQLAYHKLYGKLTATYESASTRRFLLGRVDCIRSATTEALLWVSAMNQTNSDDNGSSLDPLQPNKRVTFSLYTESEKRSLFEAAVKQQTEIMVDNILGQGIDIHLLGLREQAKEMGMSLELFEDEAYRIANHFALSTSQVATSSDSFMGYGPVVPNGYGASYNPQPTSIIFCISAFHSSETTKASKFAASLEDSLNAMQLLLEQCNTSN